jgi:hypothetical protein
VNGLFEIYNLYRQGKPTFPRGGITDTTGAGLDSAEHIGRKSITAPGRRQGKCCYVWEFLRDFSTAILVG